jgi:hypothetical protein
MLRRLLIKNFVATLQPGVDLPSSFTNRNAISVVGINCHKMKEQRTVVLNHFGIA